MTTKYKNVQCHLHIVPVEVQSKEGFYLKYEKKIPLTIYFKTLLSFKKVLHTIKHKTVLNMK